MTVVGRLGALFIILGGVALLVLDGFRSSPGLWYAATGIVAGTTMVMYTVISSPFHRHPQLATEPASPGTSDESTTPSTTRKPDSQPVDTEQTAETTESAVQGPQPASDDDSGPPDPPTSEEQSKPPATMMKEPQTLPASARMTQRKTSSTGTSHARETTRTSTHQNRYVTSTTPPRRKPSTGTDNPYFTPVDSSRDIKFAQVDARFSYLDVDWGPEFIDLDLIPDLIEVDVGPSAVSHELVRSPVEIKISSWIKALLMPSPRRTGTVASDESTRQLTATNNHTHRRTDTGRTGRRPGTRDVWDTRYREQDEQVDGHDPLAAANGRQQLTGTWSQSFYREPEDRHRIPAETGGYSSWEDIGTSDGGRSGDRRSRKCEPVMEEGPTGTQDVSVVDDPAVNVRMDYSRSRWDADPLGLSDFDPGYSEPVEPVVDPVESPELGLGLSDWEPEVSIEEPAMDPANGEEMSGLDEFPELSEEAVCLPGFDVESGSNPLLPDGENFFPGEEVEDKWLTF